MRFVISSSVPLYRAKLRAVVCTAIPPTPPRMTVTNRVPPVLHSAAPRQHFTESVPLKIARIFSGNTEIDPTRPPSQSVSGLFGEDLHCKGLTVDAFESAWTEACQRFALSHALFSAQRARLWLPTSSSGRHPSHYDSYAHRQHRGTGEMAAVGWLFPQADAQGRKCEMSSTDLALEDPRQFATTWVPFAFIGGVPDIIPVSTLIGLSSSCWRLPFPFIFTSPPVS